MRGIVPHDHLLLKVVRINIIAVVLIVIITRQIKRSVFVVARAWRCHGRRCFPQLPCTIRVRQAAFLVAAGTLVSIIRTFMHVTVGTRGAPRAEAERGEGAADGRLWVRADMSEAAAGVRAIAAREVQAGRHSFRGGVMGEIAVIACLALACEQEVSAHGDSVGIVLIAAAWSLWTCAYVERVSGFSFSSAALRQEASPQKKVVSASIDLPVVENVGQGCATLFGSAWELLPVSLGKHIAQRAFVTHRIVFT